MSTDIVIDAGAPVGALAIEGTTDTTPVTPATVVCVETIAACADELAGWGLDWGTGTGALAIAAARLPAVDGVIGIDTDSASVEVARRNARRNGVADVASFVTGDGFVPRDGDPVAATDRLDRGEFRFVVANPPASRTGDGLDWRRSLLRDAPRLLSIGAPLLVQISYQYAADRIVALSDGIDGIRYEGLAGTSAWVEFDQRRDDLRRQLVEYARVEAAGGLPYTFSDGAGGHRSATEALAHFTSTGESPLTRWQMHRFRRT